MGDVHRDIHNRIFKKQFSFSLFTEAELLFKCPDGGLYLTLVWRT